MSFVAKNLVASLTIESPIGKMSMVRYTTKKEELDVEQLSEGPLTELLLKNCSSSASASVARVSCDLHIS
jgi:hypothetical protein